MWFAIVYIFVFFFFILRMLGMMSTRLYKYMLMQDISNSLHQVRPRARGRGCPCARIPADHVTAV